MTKYGDRQNLAITQQRIKDIADQHGLQCKSEIPCGEKFGLEVGGEHSLQSSPSVWSPKLIAEGLRLRIELDGFIKMPEELLKIPAPGPSLPFHNLLMQCKYGQFD